MKRLLLASALALGVVGALAQTNVYFPGPGGHAGPACTQNTAGGGTDANVVALWHMDGNGNNVGPYGSLLNLTNVGAGVTYSTTQKQFGTGSGSWTASGASNYFATGNNTGGIPLGVSDVTIEFWEYWPSIPGNTGWATDSAGTGSTQLIGQSSAGGTVWQNVLIGSYASVGAWPLAAFKINQWQHVAFVLSGASGTTTPRFSLYVDGARIGSSPASFTVNGPFTTGIPNIPWWFGHVDGSFFFFPSGSFIDEIRISNMARYTGATITVPTQPFCNPASTYVGPGDVVAGAKAWWGTRAYTQALAVAGQKIVNVRRASDGTTCDLLSDFNGNASRTASCSTVAQNGRNPQSDFCSGTQCFVTKVYDQSGSLQCGGAACDLSQATTANQPQYNFSCFLVYSCIQFTTSSMTLNSAASGPALAQPYSISTVSQRTGAFTTRQTTFVQGTTQTQWGYNNVANQVALSNGGAAVTATASDSVSHAFMALWNGASSAIQVDATLTSGLSVATTATAGTLSIGPGTSGNPATAQVEEVGLWNVDLTSNATALCNNQYNYAYPGSTCGAIATTAACQVSGLNNTVSGSPPLYSIGSTGTILCPGARQVNACIIAGGGDYQATGSGGAGSMIFASPTLPVGLTSITIPAAPTGGTANNGANVTAFGITALGGGYGGTDGSGAAGNPGAQGGSGGGGGSDGGSSFGGGAGGGNQGPNTHAGGTGAFGGFTGGGGGGAANAGNTAGVGAGGDGKACPVDGIVYAAGGVYSNVNNPLGKGNAGQGGGYSSGVAQTGKIVLKEFTLTGTWHQVNSVIPTFSNQTNNFSGGNYRSSYRVAGYTGGLSSGTMLRITISAIPSGGTAIPNVGPFFIGHTASAGSNDFQGDQVQLTFNGGSTTVNLPASGTVVSDPVSYAWTPTKDTLISLLQSYTATPNIVPGTSAGTNVQSNDVNAGGCGAGLTASAIGNEIQGCTGTAGKMFITNKVEVLY